MHGVPTGSGVLDPLRSAVRGRVVAPDEDDYDELRQRFYGDIDRRPAASVLVRDPEDVAQVVSFARAQGLELAIRSGGHSVMGHSVTEGGLVVDLREMKALDIDVDERTVWAEAGITAGELTAAVGAHDLAIGFGDTGSVGIGGITLGGGIGFLVRKHGLTIDNLLAAEIVTADGKLLRVDDDSQSDLFWAIRGGGGNFGVVTRLKFRLHELDSIYGGMLVLPVSPETIAGFMDLATSAAEELSTIANVMVAPPMPFLPAELAGQLILMAFVVYAGDAEAGEAALAPFRKLAGPIEDMVRPMPYADMFPPEDESYRPTAVSRNMFIDAVEADTAATIIEYLGASDASLRVAQLRALGGAMARVSNEATAFAHRDKRVMVNVAAFYDGEEDKPRRQEWVDGFAAALGGSDGAAYVGFLTNDGREAVRAAYPGSAWERLAAIKAKYDPENLFRLNHNIPPGSGRSQGGGI